MRNWMGAFFKTLIKRLVMVAVILMPSLVLFLPAIWQFKSAVLNIPCIYIIAILLVIFVKKRKLCSLFVLTIGFMLPYPILAFLFPDDGVIFVYMALIFYILPFMVITFIMASASSFLRHIEQIEQLKKEDLNEDCEKESGEPDNIAKNQEIEALEKSYARKWKIGIIAVISIAAVALCTYYVIEGRFETVLVSRPNKYIYDYQEYYYKTEEKTYHALFGDSYYTKIYFIPGKKDALLVKIKEDVNNEVKKIVEENSDIFYKYEIDDFIRVYLYKNAGNIDEVKFHELKEYMGLNISSKIEFYRQIKDYENRGYSQSLIQVIENEIQ